MTERSNRRDEIVEVAARLFAEHGYTSTSVRQIAEAVGVTEAALYYHFKDGKRELLSAVLECRAPDLIAVLEHCTPSANLYEVFINFASGMSVVGQRKLENFRWILADYPRFTPDERVLIQQKHLMLHDGLAEIIRRFVADPGQADRLAWMIILFGFGYGTLFLVGDLQSVVKLDFDRLVDELARRLSADS